MLREIIQTKDTGGTFATEEILRSHAIEVENFDDYLSAVLTDLRDTMWHHSICVGLAAPQIGVGLRIAVVNWSRNSRENDLIFVNPKILQTSGKKDVKRESCMSLWGLYGDVQRRDKINIEYADESGRVSSSAFEGFPARAVQHEIDHLDGVLYRERLKSGAELTATDLFADGTWRV